MPFVWCGLSIACEVHNDRDIISYHGASCHRCLECGRMNNELKCVAMDGCDGSVEVVTVCEPFYFLAVNFDNNTECCKC